MSKIQSDADIWAVAMLAHQINKAYCLSIGDVTQPDWDQAPDWQKESAKNGVVFHLDHPEATPEDSHKAWLAEKKREGWGWGPEKDVPNKLHPCYRPYQELPQEQRSKDFLFKAVIEHCRRHGVPK